MKVICDEWFSLLELNKNWRGSVRIGLSVWWFWKFEFDFVTGRHVHLLFLQHISQQQNNQTLSTRQKRQRSKTMSEKYVKILNFWENYFYFFSKIKKYNFLVELFICFSKNYYCKIFFFKLFLKQLLIYFYYWVLGILIKGWFLVKQ